LKTGDVQAFGGSNPSPSARLAAAWRLIFLAEGEGFEVAKPMRVAWQATECRLACRDPARLSITCAWVGPLVGSSKPRQSSGLPEPLSGVPATDSDFQSSPLRGRHRLRRCGLILPALRCGRMIVRPEGTPQSGGPGGNPVHDRSSSRTQTEILLAKKSRDSKSRNLCGWHGRRLNVAWRAGTPQG